MGEAKRGEEEDDAISDPFPWAKRFPVRDGIGRNMRN